MLILGDDTAIGYHLSAVTDIKDLLIWTENYWIGGSDRFLVDLIGGLRDAPVRIALAGNPHPEFDAWLRRRLPWIGPRHIVPVANLVRTPLHRLDRLRHGTASPALAAPAADAASESLLWRAPIASVRLGQAALNLARLRRLLLRAAPDALLINNGGYPGVRAAAWPGWLLAGRACRGSCTSSTTWRMPRHGPSRSRGRWTGISTLPPTAG